MRRIRSRPAPASTRPRLAGSCAASTTRAERPAPSSASAPPTSTPSESASPMRRFPPARRSPHQPASRTHPSPRLRRGQQRAKDTGSDARARRAGPSRLAAISVYARRPHQYRQRKKSDARARPRLSALACSGSRRSAMATPAAAASLS